MARRWTSKLGLVLTGLALAGCGGAAPAASTPQSGSAAASAAGKPAAASASAATKPAASASAAASAASIGQLTVSYGNVSGDSVPLWVAADEGIFKKNGLDVKPLLVKGGTESMAALLSNNAQLSEGGGAEAAGATVNGADIVVIMTGTPVYPYKLYVPADIKTAADLKGKRIDVTNFASSVDVATRVGLKKLGLSVGDVTLVTMGTHTVGTAALLSGNIQGRMDNMPGAVKLEASGYHGLLDLAAEKLPAANTGINVQRAWLNAHRDVAQKFIDSMIQATVQVKKDKAGTIAVMKKEFKSQDTDAMTKTYDFFANEVFATQPFPKPDAFADIKQYLSDKQPKIKNLNLNTLLDPSLVQSAVDRGVDKQ
ncbi:MAG TPA: ABC transporter substrate-binding protein [Chloroflexota bacterium]|nr:ABC transporter substrate-binding protein [Chloroflexota bacterium]